MQDMFFGRQRAAFALAIIFTVVAGAYAQTDERANYFGVRAAVSIPNIVGGGDQEITRDYKSRVAANFGAYAELGLTKKLSVQIEADYASQGGKRNGVQPITSPIPGLPALPPGSYFYGDFKNTAYLNYIETPVMLKYTLKPGAKRSFYVLGGPYFGFLVNAKTKTSGSSTIYLDRNRTPLLLPPLGQPLPPISFDAETDVTDSINRFNIGLTGGGGVKFKANGSNYFFVEARGAYGLRPIQKDTLNNGNSHTGNLLISFGYAFKLGGK